MQDTETYEATMVMEFCTDEEAKTVYQALEPDNKPLPKGLELNTKLEGRRVVFEVRCGRPIMSLLATLDDILRMSALAENIAKAKTFREP